MGGCHACLGSLIHFPPPLTGEVSRQRRKAAQRDGGGRCSAKFTPPPSRSASALLATSHRCFATGEEKHTRIDWQLCLTCSTMMSRAARTSRPQSHLLPRPHLCRRSGLFEHFQNRVQTGFEGAVQVAAGLELAAQLEQREAVHEGAERSDGLAKAAQRFV